MEENKKDELNESNAAKRLRMLGESMDEKIHSEEDEIKKGNLWQNIWYRYKWAIIIGILILITTIPIIVMCSKTQKNDALIMYVGPVQIGDGATHNSMQNAFESILQDYNGDNKKVLQIATHTIYHNGYVDSEGNGLGASESGKNQQNLNSFKQQLMSGELVIVLIDKRLYDQEFKGQFEKFSNVGLTVDDSLKYDECSIMLKDTDFGKLSAFESLPNETLIVVNFNTINHDDGEYSAQIDYLRCLLAYEINK